MCTCEKETPSAFDLADNIHDLATKVQFMGHAVHALMTDGGQYCDRICLGAMLIFDDLEEKLTEASDNVRKLREV